LLHHVVCAKTTKDSWDNFVQHFEKNVGNILQLHQKLYDLKMEENTSMQAHIDKFWMIAY
jgi:hypothetical protein